MSTFKTYISESQLLLEENYGITHLEELPLETFIRMLKKLHELHVVQKLDGANLLLGRDRDGKFYTSREQKGGKRFYAEKDFPKRSAYDGFKSATLALFKVEDKLKALVKSGSAISVEVLFGPQPNTVIYGKDNQSYVAFLETMIGDDPTIKPDLTLPKKLAKALHGVKVQVNTTVSDTTDGETFVKMPKVTTWGFSCSDEVDAEELAKVDVKPELAALEKFLDKDNQVAEELGLDLTNYEVLKHKSPKLADERKRLEDEICQEYKMPVKDKLMAVSKAQKPSLRGMDPDSQNAYKGIEGIIFSDPESGEKFKVVDKDEFLAINKFNYQVRNRIVGKTLTAKDDASVEARGGIIGIAKIRCARLFGIPNAELPSQAKRNLEAYRGDTPSETVGNIAGAVKKLSFESIKRKMGAITTSALHDLEDELEDFKKGADSLEYELKNGKKIKYTAEIKRRTLLTFAEGRKTLMHLLKQLRGAERMEDLIVIFFKAAIKDLHAEPAPEKPSLEDEQKELFKGRVTLPASKTPTPKTDEDDKELKDSPKDDLAKAEKKAAKKPKKDEKPEVET